MIRNSRVQNLPVGPYFHLPPEATKLQSTLSSTTSSVGESSDYDGYHHPITCHDEILEYDEDGVMSCKHARTIPNDSRTKAGIVHSVCLMIFEIIHDNNGVIKVEPWF